jgi:hypothetical protein
MISFSCENCGKRFKVPRDKGGKTARCPGCGHLLQIPLPEGASPQPLAVRPAGDEILHTTHRPDHYRHARDEASDRSSLAGRQRANLILLGVILLAGFFMPTIQLDHDTGIRSVEFTNITILARDRISPSFKVLLLIPGVAGIALFVLQGAAKHPVRGIAIIFLAVMPLLIILSDKQISNAGAQLGSGPLPTDTGVQMLVIFMGLFAAPVAMLVGIRSRGYRPDSQIAYWFGIAGAAAWFAFLVAPTLPPELGSMFMMLPFKLMDKPGLGAASTGLLAMMVCFSICAFICILNRPMLEAPKVRKQADTAYWLLLIGFLVFVLAVFGRTISGFQDVVSMLKILCWFGGIFLLLPTGITDLVVGHIHHHEHEHEHEHEREISEFAHPYNEPPDIPRRIQ